jgi:hypothetical protein
MDNMTKVTLTDYNVSLLKYSETLRICQKVSEFGARRQVEDKLVWACILFTKLCVTGYSINILAPNSNVAVKKIPFWDFASLFTLTRNLIECYHTFYYLCVENITKDEYKARRSLFNLHDIHSRKTLFSFSDGESGFDQNVLDTVKDELTNTEYFKSLGNKQQAHYLKGDNAFFKSREEIEESFGMSKNGFKYVYKLFSSNAHSFPMGFYGMLHGDRGAGVKSEVEIAYNMIALDIADGYLKMAANNMLDFFPDIRDKLSKKESLHLQKNNQEDAK